MIATTPRYTSASAAARDAIAAAKAAMAQVENDLRADSRALALEALGDRGAGGASLIRASFARNVARRLELEATIPGLIHLVIDAERTVFVAKADETRDGAARAAEAYSELKRTASPGIENNEALASAEGTAWGSRQSRTHAEDRLREFDERTAPEIRADLAIAVATR